MKKMKNNTKNSVRKPITVILFAVVMIASVLALVPTATAVVCSKTYTENADFDEGTLVGVEHDTVPNQLQLSKASGILPFIWVPNSNEGTVSKYDTVTGNELGRYWTGPDGSGDPSRTTVDLQGSVWFGNRNTGTVVKIGLYEKGNWIDKNGDGDCDTSQDLNGDGDITNAAGAEILPWNTDECVLFEVPVGSATSGPRGLAIDADNDLWVGTYTDPSGNKFYHIDGDTGTIIAADTIDLGSDRSYGAVIDENGYIWSSCLSSHVLKIDPTTKAITKVPLDITSYGLGIDGKGHLFVAAWGQGNVAKIDVITNAVTYASQHCSNGRGVAVTTDGNVWVVDSHGTAVNRFDNNLNYITSIDIGSTGFSTGVAVDAAGKVWACNYDDGYLHRINPATNSKDLSKFTPGYTGSGTGMHYSYSDMTGIIAWSVTTKTGTWTVDFDSELADAPWGKVSWNSYEPSGTSVTVKVRSSKDQSIWSSWESASNGVDLISTPDGRYLQIETTLQITSGDVSPILYDLTVEIGNTPPVITCPANVTVEQETAAGTVVPLTATATDICDADPTITSDELAIYPLGTTTVTFTATDDSGNSASCTTTVTVEDTTPPVITASGEQIVLWPPNHKYHTVEIPDCVISVTDICDADVDIDDIEITSVSSDEPEDAQGSGDGNTEDDIVIVDSQTVELRAERQGGGNGRVYTINFGVTDASGNTETGSCTVWVLHDQESDSTAIDDGADAGYTVNYP